MIQIKRPTNEQRKRSAFARLQKTDPKEWQKTIKNVYREVRGAKFGAHDPLVPDEDLPDEQND